MKTDSSLKPDSLRNKDWSSVVARLGGATSLNTTARATKAFLRPREIRCAVDLLRLGLAYCLGERGLRATAAWAAAVELADVSNPAILYRLRNCGDWLTLLIGQVLATAMPAKAGGRLIRPVDATSVTKAGPEARKKNRLWRIHAAFDLPMERFGCFELTDEHGGEQLDRIPVVKGEIRIGDRAYMQPARIASVLKQGADIILRAGWRNVRWLDALRKPIDLHKELRKAGERIDRPIWVGCKGGSPLALRLVAVRKSKTATEAARRQARKQGRKSGYTPTRKTLDAAGWFILVTSLRAEEFSTDDVLALYRLRWRIELAFKRLKSVIGLKKPPGSDERSAKPWVLAHLLMILLLEPLIDALEDSPRWAYAV
jgi:Transposase DDE domain